MRYAALDARWSGHSDGTRAWNDPRPRANVCAVRAIRRFTVRPVLPEALSALGDLANNLRWSWHPPTQDVFAVGRPRSCGSRPAATRSGCSARSRPRASTSWRRRRVLRAARRRRARPRGVPHRGPLVPAPGPGRPGRDRLLLARVRHHRGAAAVLRRPRHPRRRPPQGRQRPRRPDRRRRAALPARLLQASRSPRGLAAGELPRARPRRAADLAAPRARRHAAPPSRSTFPTARR